jgi:hypothetical protein
MLDIIARLPPSTRKALEAMEDYRGYPHLLISVISRAIFCTIRYICPTLKPEDKISFIQTEWSVVVCVLPEQARINDIVAGHPYYQDAFIFRPDHHRGIPCYISLLRKALAVQPLDALNGQLCEIECCRFVAYAPLLTSGTRISLLGPRLRRRWNLEASTLGSEVIFAIH